MTQPCGQSIARRKLLRTGLSWTALAAASPLPLQARGEQAIKIGMVEPLTGAYAKLAEAEVEGARAGVDEVNRNGGILGRPVELLVEDSANSIAAGIDKTRLLIERDQVEFILGNVNSAVALAMMRVTAEKRKLHIVTGGHTDEITGAACRWNAFRICKTTTMEANAIADTLIRKFGKRWYFFTPDYSYGHALQDAFEQKLRPINGQWASDLIPLGTTDYSRFIVNAETFQPQVLVNLMGGTDQAISLEQIAESDRSRQMAIGGALFELESIMAVSDAARVGWWTMEWWWNQPSVPEVAKFNASIRQRIGRAPSARTWFGYAAVWTLALIANQERSLDPFALSRALQGFTLPPHVALDQNRTFFRAHDHQLMSTTIVGEVHPPGSDPFDVFTPRAALPGESVAQPVEASACKLAFPS
jgi:branched-chain amino acid transport system substrate-binding protein